MLNASAGKYTCCQVCGASKRDTPLGEQTTIRGEFPSLTPNTFGTSPRDNNPGMAPETLVRIRYGGIRQTEANLDT